MAERTNQVAEAGVGAVVLAAAAVFLGYALSHSDFGGALRSGYELSARFGSVGGLAPGADVRLAGVKVGSVTTIDLEPKTFLAKAKFQMDNAIHVPADSTVKITSDSLLGGQHVSIEPGGAADDLKPGGEFENVQGAVDLFGLIGQVIRPQGASPAAAGASAAPGGAATTSAPAADPYPSGR